MQRKNSLSRSVLNVTAFDLLSKVFSVLISIILIRQMSIENYATFTMFNSMASFVHGVVGSGLALAFVKYYVEQKTRQSGKNDGIFFFCIGFVSLIYGILSFTVPFISSIILVSNSVIILSLLYGFALSLNQINQAYYQAREMYSKSGITANIKFAILLIFVFISSYICKNADSKLVMLGHFICTLIAFAIGMILIFRNGERLHLSNYLNFKSMITDSIWIIMYMLVLNLFNQADIFMIKHFLDDSQVSNYGVAFKYYGIMLTLLSSIQIVLRVKTSNKEMIDSVLKQREFTINWIKKVAPISFIITALAIPASWLLFPIINGSQYNNSILTFNILMIGAGLSYITAPNMNIMRASGRHVLLFLLAVGALFINVIGNYIFIPIYGINAAAIATVVSQFFLNGSATAAILMRKQTEG